MRVLLICGALGWGISVFGVFAPWMSVKEQLTGLGARQISDDPMLIYWLRMTAGAFAAIGVLFLICAIWPERYRKVILLLGGFLVLEGIVLLVHGLTLGLSPLPFYVDTVFCLLIGGGILLGYFQAGK
jgi:peptidoglycan/LPS O-acetylase OafA/YrhL